VHKNKASSFSMTPDRKDAGIEFNNMKENYPRFFSLRAAGIKSFQRNAQLWEKRTL